MSRMVHFGVSNYNRDRATALGKLDTNCKMKVFV